MLKLLQRFRRPGHPGNVSQLDWRGLCSGNRSVAIETSSA